MGWFFSLCVECGSKLEAEAIAEHFKQLDLLLSDGRKFDCRVDVYQTNNQSLIDWWCSVNPRGLSESGIHTVKDAQDMTELGFLLYEHLRSAPGFRYALVGVEVDEVRYYHELLTRDGKADVPFDGFVVSEMIYEYLGKPVGFVPFKLGYFWTQYKGEVYSPVEH